MNCKSIQLFILLITLYSVSCDIIIGYKRTNYTIDDIEKFEVKESSPCPDTSSSTTPIYLKDIGGKDYVACEYQYFCHKNEQCLLFNTTSSLTSGFGKNTTNQVHGYYTYNSEKPSEKLIPLSCSEIQLKDGECGTEQCTADSDCYSNKCINNVCMVNNDNPAYICKTTKDGDKLKVKCLLAYQESCKEDSDCGDNSTCGLDNVCIIRPKVNDQSSTTKYILIGVALFIILLIIIIINFIVKNRKKDDGLGNRFHL